MSRSLALLFVCAIILVNGFRETLAMRPLVDDQGEKWSIIKSLSFQSLQRGSQRPSSPNPCTFVPGSNRGRCTLADVDFPAAAHPRHSPPPFPDHIVAFAAATAN